MSTASAAAGDPLSMKNVLDRVELLEKSYQEERLAVRSSPLFPFPVSPYHCVLALVHRAIEPASYPRSA